MILASYIYLVLLKWTYLISLLITIFPSPFCEEIGFIFFFSYGLLTWQRFKNTFGPKTKKFYCLKKNLEYLWLFTKFLTFYYCQKQNLKIYSPKNPIYQIFYLLFWNIKLNCIENKEKILLCKKNKKHWQFLLQKYSDIFNRIQIKILTWPWVSCHALLDLLAKRHFLLYDRKLLYMKK